MSDDGLRPQYLQFLELWFRHRASPEEMIEVRPLHKRPDRQATKQGFHATIERAAEHVLAALKNRDDVYVGALARSRPSGREQDVATYRWLWADVDYGTAGHAKPASHATRDAALAAIRAVGAAVGRPTMLVHTGGGFQPWWALSETADPAAWRDAIARLAHAVGGDINATDPPRILRVPGTRNFKVEPARPVVLTEIVPAGRPIERFLALPAAPADPAPPRPARPLRDPADADRPFDLANDVPVAEVFAWLGIDMHREGGRVYCACPVHHGSNPSQMVVGGDGNFAYCFGDCQRHYGPVDVVAAVRRLEPRAAVDAMAGQFGFPGFRARASAVRSVTTAEAVAVAAADAWDEPVPLDGESVVPPFPADVLQGPVGRFARELATATQTPLDLPALLALAAVSTATGRRFVVQTNYREPVNVFVAVALPSGSRKSEVFRQITWPLDEWEQVANGGLAPDAPRLRLHGTNATPEALTSRLCEQGGRYALLSPEGGGVFEMIAGRYQESPNLEVYLHGHAGDRIVVDRIKRAPETVRAPALTIGVATQPDTLKTILGRHDLAARGLPARFLFAVPRSNIGFRDVYAPAVSRPSREAYRDTIHALLGIHEDVDEHGHARPRALTLSPDAHAVDIAWRQRVEARQRPDGDLVALGEWSTKLAGAALRLAGLLHLAEHAGTPTPWTAPLSGDVVERAVYLADEYLVPHARAAFGGQGEGDALSRARRLLGWLQRSPRATFTVRDAYRALGARGERERIVDPALRVLLDHGWIREAPASESGRRSGRPVGTQYVTHPSLAPPSTGAKQPAPAGPVAVVAARPAGGRSAA